MIPARSHAEAHRRLPGNRSEVGAEAVNANAWPRMKPETALARTGHDKAASVARIAPEAPAEPPVAASAPVAALVLHEQPPAPPPEPPIAALVLHEQPPVPPPEPPIVALVLHEQPPAPPPEPPITALVLHEQLPAPPPEPEAPRRTFPYQEFASDLDPGTVKARYLIGPVDPTILFVGDLDDRHAPDVLVRAMPAILKKHPQARLVLVGDGPLLWPLRVMSRYMLLDYAVRIVGHVGGSEIRELVAAADLVAVPSPVQTEDWQILAGWSARRPVVATRAVSGELCRHEKNSVLVDAEAASFVAGIHRVLSDPDLGHRLGLCGYRKVVDELGERPPAAGAGAEEVGTAKSPSDT